MFQARILLMLLALSLLACGQQVETRIIYPHIVSSIGGWPLVLEQQDHTTGAVQFSIRCLGRADYTLPLTITFRTAQRFTTFEVPEQGTCRSEGGTWYMDTWTGVGREPEAFTDLTITYHMRFVKPNDQGSPDETQERRFVVKNDGALYRQP